MTTSGTQYVQNVEMSRHSILVQGIQANFPHKAIRTWGCHFLTLLKWAEVKNGLYLTTTNEIIAIFKDATFAGLINGDNSFIRDNLGFMNFITKGAYTKFIRKDEKMLGQQLQVVGLGRSQGGTHFILEYNDGSTWDSLPPDRPAAKTWSPANYRIFV